jgi:hypothetical protein
MKAPGCGRRGRRRDQRRRRRPHHSALHPQCRQCKASVAQDQFVHGHQGHTERGPDARRQRPLFAPWQTSRSLHGRSTFANFTVAGIAVAKIRRDAPSDKVAISAAVSPPASVRSSTLPESARQCRGF